MYIAINGQGLGEKLKAGIPFYFLNLLKSLAKIDSENSYTIYLQRELESQCSMPKNENFKFKILHSPFPYRLWRYTRLPAELLLHKPDIFFCPITIPGLPYPSRTIFTVHDIHFLLSKVPYKTQTLISKYPFFSFFIRRVFSFFIRRAGSIIVPSLSTKRDLIKFTGINPEKVYLIYESHDTDIFKPELDKGQLNKIKQRYNIGTNYILYVGTLEPRKNVSRLIEAFALLKKAEVKHKLVIAGKKGWDYEPIFTTVNKFGLEREAIFTGYVPQEDLPILMSGADVFVFPSLYEGFGIPPLEAMACGTPVVTSNISSLPEVVGDAGILVSPYSIEEIAQAMYRVLSDSELRQQMRQKGLERAKMFSLEKEARETLKVFEAVHHSN